MSFITYSAIANINDTGWEVWNDDDYEYTYIDKFGDIAKADLMALTLKHDDCFLTSLLIDPFPPS